MSTFAKQCNYKSYVLQSGSLSVETVSGSPARLKQLSRRSARSRTASAPRARPDTGNTITGSAQTSRSRVRAACRPAPPPPPAAAAPATPAPPADTCRVTY